MSYVKAMKDGALMVALATLISACGGGGSGSGADSARDGGACLRVGDYANKSFPMKNICDTTIRVSSPASPETVISVPPKSTVAYPFDASRYPSNIAFFGACIAPRKPDFSGDGYTCV